MEYLKTRTVELKNLVSTYTEHGEGDETILLFPGWPVGTASWAKVQEILASEGKRVVVANVPGLGGSELFPKPYTFENLASWAVELTDTLGIVDPTLGGHSFGACVALSAAAIGLGKKTIAVSPPIKPKEHVNKRSLISWRLIEHTPGMANLALKKLKNGDPTICRIAFGEELDFSNEHVVRVFQESVDNLQLRAVRDTLNLMLRSNLKSKIERIKTPYLIVVGSEEPEFIHQARLVTTSPVIIKGASHKSIATHPSEIAALFNFSIG